LTLCPNSMNPSPSLRPTSPDPRIPIFMVYDLQNKEQENLNVKHYNLQGCSAAIK
jgi:hypothetical protein